MLVDDLSFSELNGDCQLALMDYAQLSTVYEAELYFSLKKFRYEIIDIDEAKRRCMSLSEDLWGCTDFDEYHQLYLRGGDIPNHGDSRWPCIAPGYGEWLDDGWHRFHSYVRNGDKYIPLLTFQ